MIEFKTEKGEFVVSNEKLYLVNHRGHYSAYSDHTMKVKIFDYVRYLKLSECTEEQAKGVVDEYEYQHKSGKVLYNLYYIGIRKWCTSALQSLHSLLTSKGIDINNGNWYLFKKV